MAFEYNITDVVELVSAIVNFIGNIVYAFTGQSQTIVSVIVLGLLSTSLYAVLRSVGKIMTMKWSK